MKPPLLFLGRSISMTRVACVGIACAISAGPTACHRQNPGSVSRPAQSTADAVTASTSPPIVFGQAAPPFTTPPTLAGVPDFVALAEKVKPGVVNITTSSKARAPSPMLDPFEFFFENPFRDPSNRFGPTPNQRWPGVTRRSLGSGFIIDKDGYIVTNNHVVEGADDISVKLWDGRDLKATTAGKDSKLDVALLKLTGASDLPAVVIGDSDKVRVGEYVVAVGNPFGLGQTVTTGIVSAKDRTIGAGPYDDFIQTDASINPGNSGGPLFNLRGEVVGMNTAMHAQGQGIGFAIPANLVRDVVTQLRASGHVSRGKLGLVFQPVTDEIAKAIGLKTAQGALVSEVEPGGPADKAGIRSGDLIIKVNDEPVTDGAQLPRMVARHPPGETVSVVLKRQGKELTIRVVLGTLKGDNDADDDGADNNSRTGKSDKAQDFGLSAQPAHGGGVRITGVGTRTSNLHPGDVVLQVDGKDVASLGEITAALSQAARQKRPALFKIKRDKRVQFVAVDVSPE